jgi:choline dehydrogenase-like flavoprotein
MPWSADVVIVGSGVAGSIVAAWLAKDGLKVLILEAGPRVQRATALTQYRGALIKVPESPYPDAPFAPHPRAIDSTAITCRMARTSSAAPTCDRWAERRGTGRTTLRFVPDDFELRSRFGVGLDWPLSYDDLEPWYGEAERELGVAGDPKADLDAPRSQAYPLPPIPLSYLDQRVAGSVAGTSYSVQPTPQARNSLRYDNRPACCGSSSCIPICPIQAKYDATTHVVQAERAGAELVAEAIVSHVEVGLDGRITALTVKRPDGTEDRAVGRVFVIAAHGIETPKLLLQSRSERWPRGVANSSDQVGRNLMDHPSQLSWALAGEPLWPYRGPLSTGGIESTRAGSWRGEHAAFRIQLSNTGWAWPRGTPDSTVRELVQGGLRCGELIAPLPIGARGRLRSRRWLSSCRHRRTASFPTSVTAMRSAFPGRGSRFASTTTPDALSSTAAESTGRSARR